MKKLDEVIPWSFIGKTLQMQGLSYMYYLFPSGAPPPAPYGPLRKAEGKPNLPIWLIWEKRPSVLKKLSRSNTLALSQFMLNDAPLISITHVLVTLDLRR